MTNQTKHFIIVDDDQFSNFLSKMVLAKLLGDAEVKDFVNPELALEYIKTDFNPKQREEKTILLIDINMPTLTGWEFLDEFKTFAEPLKNQFNIFMLSSSINPDDILRAKQHALVKDFIEKPLNKDMVSKILS